MGRIELEQFVQPFGRVLTARLEIVLLRHRLLGLTEQTGDPALIRAELALDLTLERRDIGRTRLDAQRKLGHRHRRCGIAACERGTRVDQQRLGELGGAHVARRGIELTQGIERFERVVAHRFGIAAPTQLFVEALLRRRQLRVAFGRTTGSRDLVAQLAPFGIIAERRSERIEPGLCARQVAGRQCRAGGRQQSLHQCLLGSTQRRIGGRDLRRLPQVGIGAVGTQVATGCGRRIGLGQQGLDLGCLFAALTRLGDGGTQGRHTGVVRRQRSGKSERRFGIDVFAAIAASFRFGLQGVDQGARAFLGPGIIWRTLLHRLQQIEGVVADRWRRELAVADVTIDDDEAGIDFAANARIDVFARTQRPPRRRRDHEGDDCGHADPRAAAAARGRCRHGRLQGRMRHLGRRGGIRGRPRHLGGAGRKLRLRQLPFRWCTRVHRVERRRRTDRKTERAQLLRRTLVRIGLQPRPQPVVVDDDGLQRLGEFLQVRVALVAILREHAIKHRLEFPELRRQRRRRIGQMRHQYRDRRFALERWPPGQQFVEHHAEAVQVGAAVHLERIDLLRAHVGRRTDQHAGLGQPRRRRVLLARDAEVGQHRRQLVAEHDVRGLEVAVHDAVVVGELQRTGDLHDDCHGFGQRQTAAHLLVQRAAFQILHRNIGRDIALDDVVYRDDVPVRQLRQRAPFDQETTLELVGVVDVPAHHLDRDLAIERALDRQIHGRHAAHPEFADQLVTGDVEGGR